MSSSTPLSVHCAIFTFAACLTAPQFSAAQTSQPADPRAACAADIQRLCPNVPSGGGRILACLSQQRAQVSDGCKRAILSSMNRSNPNAMSGSTPNAMPGNSQPPASANPYPPPAASTPYPAAPAATPTPPPPTEEGSFGPGTLPPSSSPTKSTSLKSHSASSAAGPHYFVMKQVKIIDSGIGKGQPAYDLLIPKDWQFKGAVNIGVADGGCFADWFSVFADARANDDSLDFQMLPQQTFQYIDDPNGQRQMQTQNQNDVRFGMKACPVRAPISAAAFLRQDILKKMPADSTVVSVEPYPELADLTRHQLGLPPASSGGNTGNTRVDAARMRISYDYQGKPAEAWVTTAIVVHIMPGAGRGAAYDWHAVNVMINAALKGKLDANEKLFNLIASTIHPEPAWLKMSNGYIAQLYQFKAKQVAQQSQEIAAFRQHAADVINGVTANQMAGAAQSNFGQDQLIRGVQTFRDPATGATLELSNQYDHAWLNSSNEYVMSDDPSFNPNGTLSGSWNQLQLVHAQP